MCFPLHRTCTVIADWMSPLSAELGFIILRMLNYHNFPFCMLTSPCGALLSTVVPEQLCHQPECYDRESTRGELRSLFKTC